MAGQASPAVQPHQAPPPARPWVAATRSPGRLPVPDCHSHGCYPRGALLTSREAAAHPRLPASTVGQTPVGACPSPGAPRPGSPPPAARPHLLRRAEGGAPGGGGGGGGWRGMADGGPRRCGELLGARLCRAVAVTP